MRWFVFGKDQILANWVAKELDVEFGVCTAIGYANNDQILAVCVYHNYQPRYGNIEMSIASSTPMWARPEVINTFMRYPFVQLKCRRVTALTRARNVKSRNFLAHIGFRKEGCMQQGFGNEDAIIYGILKKKWKEL